MLRRVLLAALVVCCSVGVSVGQSAAVGCVAFYDNLKQPYDVATDSSGNLYVRLSFATTPRPIKPPTSILRY